MAGRKQGNNAAAVATAVTLLALLAGAAGDAGRRICNVDMAETVVEDCLKACYDAREDHPISTPNKPSNGCCMAMRHADFRCLCDTFWKEAMYGYMARCAMLIPSACKIRNAPDTCY